MSSYLFVFNEKIFYIKWYIKRRISIKYIFKKTLSKVTVAEMKNQLF